MATSPAIINNPGRVDRRPAMKPIAIPVREACQVGGLGRTKLYELVKTGELKTVSVGRRRLVLFASLEALLQPAA